MNLFFVIFLNFYVKGYISPDSTKIKIEYHLRGEISKIQIVYEYKGKDYIVAEKANPYFKEEVKDEFVWVAKNKWKNKGDLKLIVFYIDKRKEEYFISGKNLEVKNFMNKDKSNGYYINPSIKKTQRGPDPYAWRTFYYDLTHTHYYPFFIYPPLKLKWNYHWEDIGCNPIMISPCIGNDIFFYQK